MFRKGTEQIFAGSRSQAWCLLYNPYCETLPLWFIQYTMKRERGDFGVRGSHGSWFRGRCWQMDIHPPCLCPLEELPRGEKMHWRREAEAKPLWRGSCQALPVMRGNAYKCASWPPPSNSPSHTHTHTPNSGWESDLFSPFSFSFFLSGSRKWFWGLWTAVQAHLTRTTAHLCLGSLFVTHDKNVLTW